MQKQVSKQSLAIVALSILLAICMALTATYAAFKTDATVKGTISFDKGVILQYTDNGVSSTAEFITSENYSSLTISTACGFVVDTTDTTANSTKFILDSDVTSPKITVASGSSNVTLDITIKIGDSSNTGTKLNLGVTGATIKTSSDSKLASGSQAQSFTEGTDTAVKTYSKTVTTIELGATTNNEVELFDLIDYVLVANGNVAALNASNVYLEFTIAKHSA